MTATGEGWRFGLGVFFLVLIPVVSIASLITIHKCHYRQPLASRSKVLMQISAVGSLMTMFSPVQEVWGQDILPCWLYYWFYCTYTMPLICPILLNSWRLVRQLQFEKLKSQYQFGKVKLTDEMTAKLRNYKRWHEDPILIQFFIGHILIFMIPYIPLFVFDPYYNTTNVGCFTRSPPWYRTGRGVYFIDSLDLCFNIMVVLYMTPCNILWWNIWKLHQKGRSDAFGLTTELVVNVYNCLIGYVLFTGFRWGYYDGWTTEYPYGYFSTMQPTLYCIVGILVPTAWTSEQARQWRRLFKENVMGQTFVVTGADDAEMLQNMINDPRGFAYMLQQCRAEFAEETLQCVKAIRGFRKQPTYPLMMRLHSTFIEEHSAFEVNIAATNRHKLSRAILAIQPHCAAIDITYIFDSTEQELTTLLTNNSFVRFKKSSRYKDYVDGKACDNGDDSATNSRLQGGSVGTSGRTTTFMSSTHRKYETDGNVEVLHVQPGHASQGSKQVTRGNASWDAGHQKSETHLYNGSSLTATEEDIMNLTVPGRRPSALTVNTGGMPTRTLGHRGSDAWVDNMDEDTMALVRPGNRSSVSVAPHVHINIGRVATAKLSTEPSAATSTPV